MRKVNLLATENDSGATYTDLVIDTKLSRKVDIDGDENINGVKTFTSSPLVPEPIDNDAATPKIYVDSEISSIEHNDVNNIQGGIIGEHYHLSESDYTDKILNMQFGNVVENNYSQFEETGFLKFSGSSEYWQDIDFPIIIRTTGANIPTLTTINGNITMPQWEVNDYNICESQEFVHSWKEGSTCYWHIHLTTNGVNTTTRYVNFEIEFGYTTPNGVWIFPTTIVSGDIVIPANTPNKTMLILGLGNFTPTTTKIGGHTVARLRRISSSGAPPSLSPWVSMLQMHILCDTPGSRYMISK